MSAELRVDRAGAFTDLSHTVRRFETEARRCVASATSSLDQDIRWVADKVASAKRELEQARVALEAARRAENGDVAGAQIRLQAAQQKLQRALSGQARIQRAADGFRSSAQNYRTTSSQIADSASAQLLDLYERALSVKEAGHG